MDLLRRLFRRFVKSAVVVKAAVLLVFVCPGLAYGPLATAATLRTDPLLTHLAANPGQYALAVSCLTDAIYYEAGFEPLAGQEAIAQVVLNRAHDPHFPNSVCGVIFQGAERQTGCQFSFTCDGSLDRRPPEPDEVAAARAIASRALAGLGAPGLADAKHYHAVYVRPYWARARDEIAVIGRHIFYR